MSEKQQHHFSISHIELCDLRAVFCSVSYSEMFKSLERQDSGKIELDMQQVCERITKAAALFAFPLWTACIIVFPLNSGCAWRSTNAGDKPNQDPFVIFAGRGSSVTQKLVSQKTHSLHSK